MQKRQQTGSRATDVTHRSQSNKNSQVGREDFSDGNNINQNKNQGQYDLNPVPSNPFQTFKNVGSGEGDPNGAGYNIYRHANNNRINNAADYSYISNKNNMNYNPNPTNIVNNANILNQSSLLSYASRANTIPNNPTVPGNESRNFYVVNNSYDNNGQNPYANAKKMNSQYAKSNVSVQSRALIYKNKLSNSSNNGQPKSLYPDHAPNIPDNVQQYIKQQNQYQLSSPEPQSSSRKANDQKRLLQQQIRLKQKQLERKNIQLDLKNKQIWELKERELKKLQQMQQKKDRSFEYKDRSFDSKSNNRRQIFNQNKQRVSPSNYQVPSQHEPYYPNKFQLMPQNQSLEEVLRQKNMQVRKLQQQKDKQLRQINQLKYMLGNYKVRIDTLEQKLHQTYNQLDTMHDTVKKAERFEKKNKRLREKIVKYEELNQLILRQNQRLRRKIVRSGAPAGQGDTPSKQNHIQQNQLINTLNPEHNKTHNTTFGITTPTPQLQPQPQSHPHPQSYPQTSYNMRKQQLEQQIQKQQQMKRSFIAQREGMTEQEAEYDPQQQAEERELESKLMQLKMENDVLQKQQSMLESQTNSHIRYGQFTNNTNPTVHTANNTYSVNTRGMTYNTYSNSNTSSNTNLHNLPSNNIQYPNKNIYNINKVSTIQQNNYQNRYQNNYQNQYPDQYQNQYHNQHHNQNNQYVQKNYNNLNNKNVTPVVSKDGYNFLTNTIVSPNANLPNNPNRVTVGKGNSQGIQNNSSMGQSSVQISLLDELQRNPYTLASTSGPDPKTNTPPTHPSNRINLLELSNSSIHEQNPNDQRQFLLLGEQPTSSKAISNNYVNANAVGVAYQTGVQGQANSGINANAYGEGRNSNNYSSSSSHYNFNQDDQFGAIANRINQIPQYSNTSISPVSQLTPQKSTRTIFSRANGIGTVQNGYQK